MASADENLPLEVVGKEEINSGTTESTVSATEESSKMDTSGKDGKSAIKESTLVKDNAAESQENVAAVSDELKAAHSERHADAELTKVGQEVQGDQKQTDVSVKDLAQDESVTETPESVIQTGSESVKETPERVIQTGSGSIEDSKRIEVDTKEQAQVENRTIAATSSTDSGKVKEQESVQTGRISSDSDNQAEPHSKTDTDKGDESMDVDKNQDISVPKETQEQSSKELSPDLVSVSQDKDKSANVSDSNVDDEPMETENEGNKMQIEQSNVDKSDSEQIDSSRVHSLKVSPPDVMSEDANEPNLVEDDVRASPSAQLDLDKVEIGDTGGDKDIESNGAGANVGGKQGGDGANAGSKQDGDGEALNKDVSEEPPAKRKRGGEKDENQIKLEELGFHGLIFPAQNVFEYQWPQEDKMGEWYFVQEQITEYLGVTSFKRKYPDIERRAMPGKEKDFLRERGVVSEEQATLGLFALKSDDIYDLMMKEYPDKYHDYIKVMREKEQQSIKEKKEAYSKPVCDKSKIKDFMKKAAKAASEYNSLFMKERREERKYYFDMQTLTVQIPANKMRKLDKEYTKPGPYPVALIPGQFQNYYRKFTSEELKYFPINTALYGPSSPRRQDNYAQSTKDEDASDDDSIPVSLSGDESTAFDSGSSSSGSDSDSSSEDGEQGDDVDGADLPLPLQPPKSEGREVPIDEKPKQPAYVPKNVPDAICGLCLKDKSANKKGETEDLVHCSQCDNSGHPSCLEMTDALVKVILSYPWQCMECKTCMHCGDPTEEEKMMFCDDCDRGYHTFCVGLKDIPTGNWACESCATTSTNNTTVTLTTAELPMEQASLEPIQDATTSSTEQESAATESEATAPESSATESAAEPGALVTPNKPIKKRGRPPGSKNKPKDKDATPKEKKSPKEKKEEGTPSSIKKAKKKLKIPAEGEESPQKSPAAANSSDQKEDSKDEDSIEEDSAESAATATDPDAEDSISESPATGDETKKEPVTPVAKVKKPRGRPPKPKKDKETDSPVTKKAKKKLKIPADGDESPQKSPAAANSSDQKEDSKDEDSPEENSMETATDPDAEDSISESPAPGEETKKEPVIPVAKVKKPRGRPPRKDKDSPVTKKGIIKNEAENASQESEGTSDSEIQEEKGEKLEESSSDEEMEIELAGKRSRGRPPKKRNQTPVSVTKKTASPAIVIKKITTPSSVTKKIATENDTPGRQLRGHSSRKAKESPQEDDSQPQNDSSVEDIGSAELTSSAKRSRGRPPKKSLPSDDKEEQALDLTLDSPLTTPGRRLRGRPPKVVKETPKSAGKEEIPFGYHGYQGSPVHGYHGSPLHGYQGSPLPGYQGSPVHGYQGSPVPGYQESPLPGYQGSPLPGYQGSPLLLQALHAQASTPIVNPTATIHNEPQMEEIQMETETLTSPVARGPGRPRRDNSSSRPSTPSSRPSTPSSIAENESETEETPLESDALTPPLKRGRGRPRKDRSTPVSEVKKRKTDTPTPSDAPTPEKVDKEGSEKAEAPATENKEGPTKAEGEENTTTDSPSTQEQTPSAEGENPTESKLPQDQATPTPKRRGRPPKNKNKDTPTSSGQKVKIPRKKAETEEGSQEADGDKAETPGSTSAEGTPTPKAADDDSSTPVAPAKKRGRPAKNKDSPAAAKRAKKLAQEDSNSGETPLALPLDRLQAETPVESPATSNQDSDSVITGTEAPSESISSSEQTPDITPSPTPDLQGANIGAPAVGAPDEMVQKTIAPPGAPIDLSQGVMSEAVDKVTSQETDPKVAPSVEKIEVQGEPEKAKVSELEAKVAKLEAKLALLEKSAENSPVASAEASSESATSI